MTPEKEAEGPIDYLTLDDSCAAHRWWHVERHVGLRNTEIVLSTDDEAFCRRLVDSYNDHSAVLAETQRLREALQKIADGDYFKHRTTVDAWTELKTIARAALNPPE